MNSSVIGLLYQDRTKIFFSLFVKTEQSQDDRKSRTKAKSALISLQPQSCFVVQGSMVVKGDPSCSNSLPVIVFNHKAPPRRNSQPEPMKKSTWYTTLEIPMLKYRREQKHKMMKKATFFPSSRSQHTP